MIDAQWTGWSTIKDLTFVRSDGDDAGTVLQSTPENFEDAWKFAIGANYRVDRSWMVRAGLAYDESPVQMAFRTPRLPDNDRTWLTAGGQYRFANGVALDFGAAYIWVSGANVNKNGDPPNTARLRPAERPVQQQHGDPVGSALDGVLIAGATGCRFGPVALGPSRRRAGTMRTGTFAARPALAALPEVRCPPPHLPPPRPGRKPKAMTTSRSDTACRSWPG